MAQIYKLLGTETQVQEDTRTVEVICSTETADRIGDIIVQEGIDVASYRKNPVVLWGHDSNKPVARSSDIFLQNNQLRANVTFPPPGEDKDSDWVYGKVKNKLVNAVSIGFIPKSYEPVDAKNPWDGYRFTETELVEFSFVSVPMNSEALIVGRSMLPPVSRDLMLPSTIPDDEPEPEPEPQPEPEGKSLSDALDAIIKADPPALSAANEEQLRMAQTCIQNVLDDLVPDPEDPNEPNEPGEMDASRAPIVGRSQATRFPRRTQREVELMKLRAGLH